MTISFNTSEMSSYSEDKAAYIMEAGDYVIRVGNSSRNTTPAAVLNLDEEAVTEQLKNNMSIDRDGKYPGGSSGEYDDLTDRTAGECGGTGIKRGKTGKDCLLSGWKTDCFLSGLCGEICGKDKFSMVHTESIS